MGVIIKFKDQYENDQTELEVRADDNLISICLECDSEFIQINLDTDTAVKFSKELRKQIAIAKDFELNSEDDE